MSFRPQRTVLRLENRDEIACAELRVRRSGSNIMLYVGPRPGQAVLLRLSLSEEDCAELMYHLASALDAPANH
jgi:hypothetical protein